MIYDSHIQKRRSQQVICHGAVRLHIQISDHFDAVTNE